MCEGLTQGVTCAKIVDDMIVLRLLQRISVEAAMPGKQNSFNGTLTALEAQWGFRHLWS